MDSRVRGNDGSEGSLVNHGDSNAPLRLGLRWHVGVKMQSPEDAVEKIWLKQYPEGIPAEVDIDRYASLKEILEQSCARFAKLPAYRNMGVSISYRKLDETSRAFGAYLQKSLGLKKGDRVAIMLPNLL